VSLVELTELILAGNLPAYVQQLARHSDIRMTMKYYADASRFPLADSINKLPSYGSVLGIENTELQRGAVNS